MSTKARWASPPATEQTLHRPVAGSAGGGAHSQESSMIPHSVKADGQDTAEVVARFLFEQGGRLADIHGATPRELEATYAFAYSLYTQARWREALRVFGFLVQEAHLDRRFHLGRAGC